MKIIHCADIHLGSKLESKFTKEISDIRKREVLNSFGRMIDFANKNDIKIIILSGDVFDRDKPFTKDKEYFYKQIKNNSQIDFIYLNGNHDKDGSYIEDNIENLKTFNKDNFISYEYGDIVITGLEMTQDNAKSFYSHLSLQKDKKNILMLHGDVSDTIGMDKIRIDSLKNKNIDYLALGHIHSFKTGKIDDRGIWAFPGCLEGRGFDECGPKGFIVLNIDDNIKFEFVPFSNRVIYNLDVNVTGAKDLVDIQNILKERVSDIDKKNILSINLVGELPMDIEMNEEDIKIYLSSYFFVDVKDNTSIKIDISKYNDDKSLIGEFIKGVYSSDKYTEETKQKLISLGLKAIAGKEVE